MSNKNKKNQSPAEKLNEVALQGGLVLMAAATTLGLVELPEHPNKVILTAQPAFVVASDAIRGGHSEPIRREKEETAPHYISYNTSQRTPGRTGMV